MATTYTWVISQMDTAPSEDGLTDVVKTVHWRYRATDDAYTAEVYGSVGFPAPEASAFVPYADLTETQVTAWLEGSLNVENLKTNLDGQIAALKNPPIVNLPLPWAG